jgi:hypothetical protein
MLESETRMSFPPAPPPPPPPPTKRRNVVVVVAISASIFVLASVIWLLSAATGSPEEKEEEGGARRFATTVTSPVASPSPITTPGPGRERDRILAIIADAHSGKYFSNEFQDTYSKAAEMAMVKGMILRIDDDPITTEPLLACTLSFVETHVSSHQVLSHPQSAKKIGLRAGFACSDYMNL